ncbi:MAG: amino acid permease [Natrialbaceae archaeon]|nr:amino acid permease [Natrialbaceae archaeon]
MEAPSKTIPRAIGISIVVSTAVYIFVALSALGLVEWQVLGSSQAPLATVAREGWGSDAFVGLSAIALFATANTVLDHADIDFANRLRGLEGGIQLVSSCVRSGAIRRERHRMSPSSASVS